MATKKEEVKKEKKTTEKKVVKKEVKVNKTISGLSFRDEMILIYVIPFVAIVYAFMKDRIVEDKTRFHYNQAATSGLLMICFGVFSVIPYLGFIAYIPIFALIVFNIITLYKEIKENISYEIPLVSNISTSIFK